MRSRLAPLLLCALLLMSALPLPAPVSASDEASVWPPTHVVISEVLISASGEDYNGTDWNGDGYFGSGSDQYIELWNPTNEAVDISNWRLDDTLGAGSAPCSIGWNTTLAPDARMAFFRDNTRLELDYWDGDSVNLANSWGDPIHSMSYAGEDSWWDVPYSLVSNGSFVKDFDGPSPGVDTPADWTGPGPGERCFSMSETRHSGEYILTGRIVTMTSQAAVFETGGVLVRDGLIAAVWSGDAIPSAHAGIQVISTGGTIYPGLLDAHNHIHYNTVPLWDMGDNVYNNRYQWKNHPGYKPEVTWPKTLLSSGSYWNMEIEALKHAEMKAIVGGTTSVQGNPTNDDSAYTWVLARNMEHNNFGRDQMHTKVTELESDYVGNHIKTGSAAGTLDAWFLHLSEGKDASSLAEFQILVDNDLLVPELNLVHGVPLGASEYQQMGAVGASLIWSPTSNLLLYGETADVAAAKAAGVNILLAPDWSPSGTKSPLHELKMADWLDENRLGNIFTDYEQVEMVTTNVVDGIGWTSDVGRIQTGLAADLVVIDSFHSNPYRNLIEALDPDVSLTIVGGLPIYGDVNLMTQLNGDDKEVITWNGMTKALDVTFMGVDDGEQTWAEIEAGLEMALQFNKADMHANFGAAGDMDLAEFTIWADDKWPQLDAIGLDSIFTWGDERYFDRLNGSVGFNQISNIDLWSAYYDIEYDENMNRPGVVVEVPVDVWNLDDYRPVFASNDPITVTMKVSYGDGQNGVIGFDLYPDKAPFHVDNMLRHIDAGNYDGAKFHRVINDFMIQGGDFESGNGMGGYAARFYGYCNGLEAMPDTCDQTAWTLPDEAGNGLLHTEGALSMAKTSSPNTGGSQFFIVDAGPTPTHLDGVHTVFGRVTGGLDVVNSISEVEVLYPNRPLDDVLIVSFERGEPSDDPELIPEEEEGEKKSSSSSLAIYAGIAATGLIIIASLAMMQTLRKEDDSLE